MSSKCISEQSGKVLLSKYFAEFSGGEQKIEGRAIRVSSHDHPNASVSADGNFNGENDAKTIPFAQLAQENPWVLDEKLVVKPDQLIKRRGKANLVGLDLTWAQVTKWIEQHMGEKVNVDNVDGVLDTFIVEPFLPHTDAEEHYICIYNTRAGEDILFCREGGVDVGDVDAKASRISVNINDTPTAQQLMKSGLFKELYNAADEVSATTEPEPEHVRRIATFLEILHKVYRELHFTYIEINPLVIQNDVCAPLDLAAKLDETAAFLVEQKWGDKIVFPPSFGRPMYSSELIVKSLDAKTGASLKFTILNPQGRIYTLVAGGGASVVYADTICDLGYGAELANYGEYSGAPSEEITHEYARVVLQTMTQNIDPRGKILIIGGGIANFTNVAETFTGIAKALTEFAPKLIRGNVTVWVRRGGPNYQEGLKMMRELGSKIGVPIHVYGPKTNIVKIVPMALGLIDADDEVEAERIQNYSAASSEDGESRPASPEAAVQQSTAKSTTPTSYKRKNRPQTHNELPVANNSNESELHPAKQRKRKQLKHSPAPGSSSSSTSTSGSGSAPSSASGSAPNSTPGSGSVERCDPVADTNGKLNLPQFNSSTKAIVYGMQLRAVQGMLDADYVFGRTEPSVAAIVFPFSGDHSQRLYFGKDDINIKVYTSLTDAIKKHQDASVLINFASLRSAFSVTMEALSHAQQIRTIAVIAEGIPEQQTRKIIREAQRQQVMIIGPSTVGGIKPHAFRIGNTGGMIDNIISCKLHRPGSVAYVSKSGGMSNELNSIISQSTDGVFEGVAIGGDRWPGSTFLDHMLRFESQPEVKILVLLGEVGGTDEYDVIKAMQERQITKPVVSWVIGTCAKLFAFQVQFGHAGACAGSDAESADVKNAALKAAGAHVPSSFDQLEDVLSNLYDIMVENKEIVPKPEPPVPQVPLDYTWAKQLGLVRKPPQFVSTISDERGEELKYAGIPISQVVMDQEIGVGGVISLLWFKRRLPLYVNKFIEIILMLTADHGPAVSGAHNTIVTARAGKDLISSLTSGLLTIGPRFGGALDEAACLFSSALDRGISPREFVNEMRAQNKLIMGIGHRIKTTSNPDSRVTIIKKFANDNFPAVANSCLDFALKVEQITTSKKSNLILNVDGAIAACFVDVLRNCGSFTREEADEAIRHGVLNGLFVLGRSIGFIGHYLDQKRLNQGLYRHPTDDIHYVSMPDPDAATSA